MSLITKSRLFERAKKSSPYVSESYIREESYTSLLESARAADRSTDTFDIFLSHSSEDAIYVRGLRDLLTDAGFKVYVDWIIDPQLSRNDVSSSTASILRRRMNSCRCLLYAISSSSRRSVWMPWELGYMDSAKNSRVALVPIVENSESIKDFTGVEYLGLYPFVDASALNFWVQYTTGSFTSLERWIAGDNP